MLIEDVVSLSSLRYLELRGLSSGTSPVLFPEQYGPAERDEAYKSFSFSGWGGSSGHDAPMIALDALLGAGSNWEELMSRAAFHGGQQSQSLDWSSHLSSISNASNIPGLKYTTEAVTNNSLLGS